LLQRLLRRRLLLHLLLRLGLPVPAGSYAREERRLLLSMSQNQAHPDTESIWRTLSDRLRQFIRSRVSSAADADDILQNVFLRIHQNLEALRESTRLESWVYQIARHAILDYHRKKGAVSLDPETATAPADELTPDSLNQEIAGCLEMMIDRLPPPLRRAVALYEREDVSQNDIASREGITLSGAKSRVQRGRKLVKEMLQQCCQLELDRRGNVLDWSPPAACESTGSPCDCSGLR
jgi:RNA polymerase sigma-70 factor (ECF subfamily)